MDEKRTLDNAGEGAYVGTEKMINTIRLQKNKGGDKEM